MPHLQSVSVTFTFVIIFYSNVQLGDGLRILGIFPLNMKSHFVMCEELMKGLAAKGHRVDVYSHFPQINEIKNYQDFRLPRTVPILHNNVNYEEITVVAASMETKKQWFGSFQQKMCDLLGHSQFQRLLRDPPKDPPYDLFITELSAINCYIPIGRHFNIPGIAVITPHLQDWHYDGFDTPFNLATTPSGFSKYLAPMTFYERLNNVILSKMVVGYFLKYTKLQNRYVEKYFGPGLPNTCELQKDVSLILLNHDVALNGPVAFAPKVIPVGGLHVVDHKEPLSKKVQKWLDESNHGCIYFSFGFLARIETFPRPMPDAFYKSFEKIAPVRVLWKITKPDDLPGILPSNVFTKNWFNQIAVLKHPNVKAFVTHGGLMSGHESIYFEKPMVAVPIFGDQFINTQVWLRKNIAVEVPLDKVTESTFTNAVEQVLNDPRYRDSVRKLNRKMRDRPLSVMDTAIFWVEYISIDTEKTHSDPILQICCGGKSLF